MKLWLDKGVWTRKKAKQKAALLDLEKIQTIGVIKHAALGDLMATRPFLITLREYCPNAKITLGEHQLISLTKFMSLMQQITKYQ